jgi:seryl-tRNA synthetase
MLDIKRIRESEPEVRRALERRRASPAVLDSVVAVDKERRRLLTDVEAMKSRRNTVSKELGIRKQKGEDIAEPQKAMRELGDQIAQIDQRLAAIDEELRSALLMIPNVPHNSVQAGADAKDNEVVRTWGEVKKLPFAAKPHWELGAKLGLFDFERGAKISGAGFPLYMGQGARLQRALVSFMLDLHTREHGYREVAPPYLVNAASMTGTGQLPKMKEDMYFVGADELYLIPTAEVPVTNIYRDEIISAPLPIYLAAYTPCFRREAGAAGRETRGLIRVHQFDKVELVKFVPPETSYDELEKLVGNAEVVLQRLGLAYRVVRLCTGDLSFAAAKCYDIELWAPGQDAWLEISSCSNFEDFQARRANIRYRKADGKTAFVHTLNGSGVALARLVVAILENYQQADGSVVVPEALRPYLGGLERFEGAS